MPITEKEKDLASQIGLAVAMVFPAMLKAADGGDKSIATKILSAHAITAKSDGDEVSAQIFLQCALAIDRTWK